MSDFLLPVMCIDNYAHFCEEAIFYGLRLRGHLQL